MRSAAQPVRMAQVKRSKYRAQPTVVDGIRFASAAESRRYAELKLLEQSGAIQSLELQPSYPLTAFGTYLGTYRGDFLYRTPTGQTVLEDVKGVRTPLYRWKAKHMRAQYGIEIQEIR